MTLEIALEMVEALATDNLMSITTLGENGDEVAQILYGEIIRLSNEMPTSRKKGFAFNDGGPVDNRFMFCPYCGRTIKENRPSAQEEES